MKKTIYRSNVSYISSSALILFITFLSVTSSIAPLQAQACSRFVYHGVNSQIITARSMDWKEDIASDIWILPRGIARNGQAGPNSIKWTAKYGSVVTTAYDIATTDGLNEKGLVANLLWLADSEYPKPDKNKPAMAISLWAQYILDNYATVKEAVTALQAEPFHVYTAEVPGQKRLATLHLSISDSSGDSAIIEYIGGKQVIHHNRQYQVMTNEPTYEKQLAIQDYWKEVDGIAMLPGTSRPADRFARASFYVSAIPKSKDPEEALASVFGVIRNVSVPLGISTPNRPNISSTRWRSVVDHKRLLYFFESVMTPNVFWVDLKQVDFSADKGKVKKLSLGKNQRTIYAGNATSSFQNSAPFKFLGL
ncbi:linear amide C-N hydrolase [Pseudobdellovibrio exovorus]|uniref:Choloylglycine hydrolase/NAAA C-terminal domain-containing protein n=1 Tax=Pseudobdellovibrio exovorus JSS TaxID=1184267 RepID=M4V9K3_9BACT|nr:linear amide C-N hydrolase [Pseudobdellovibrio exovorus]AGH95898.1 hypothetical protein A11Q_1682 [Pseudobdellovibrio exovorus JSS]